MIPNEDAINGMPVALEDLTKEELISLLKNNRDHDQFLIEKADKLEAELSKQVDATEGLRTEANKMIQNLDDYHNERMAAVFTVVDSLRTINKTFK